MCSSVGVHTHTYVHTHAGAPPQALIVSICQGEWVFPIIWKKHSVFVRLWACAQGPLGRKHTCLPQVPEHDSCAALAPRGKMFPVFIKWREVTGAKHSLCHGTSTNVSLSLFSLLCPVSSIFPFLFLSQPLRFQSLPLFLSGAGPLLTKGTAGSCLLGCIATSSKLRKMSGPSHNLY